MVQEKASAMAARTVILGLRVLPLRMDLIVSSETSDFAANSPMVTPLSFISIFNLFPISYLFSMLPPIKKYMYGFCFIRVLYDDLSRKSIEKCIEIHKLIAKYVKSVENTLVMKKKYDIIIHVSSW